MLIISLNMHDTKNVPSRNELYRKNYPRNHREKFGSDDYLIVVGSALSTRIDQYGMSFLCTTFG